MSFRFERKRWGIVSIFEAQLFRIPLFAFDDIECFQGLLLGMEIIGVAPQLKVVL